MPLYEYQCTNCSERVEIIQRVSDPPHGQCPKCGAEMKKLFSAPAIQFKGSGFYKTDYASKPESKPETKTETKSETKSESSTASTSPTPTKSE